MDTEDCGLVADLLTRLLGGQRPDPLPRHARSAVHRVESELDVGLLDGTGAPSAAARAMYPLLCALAHDASQLALLAEDLAGRPHPVDRLDVGFGTGHCATEAARLRRRTAGASCPLLVRATPTWFQQMAMARGTLRAGLQLTSEREVAHGELVLQRVTLSALLVRSEHARDPRYRAPHTLPEPLLMPPAELETAYAVAVRSLLPRAPRLTVVATSVNGLVRRVIAGAGVALISPTWLSGSRGDLVLLPVPAAHRQPLAVVLRGQDHWLVKARAAGVGDVPPMPSPRPPRGVHR